MGFSLPPLPFDQGSLSPFISPETIEFHYGKHHKGYVDNLNKLIAKTEHVNKTLEEIVKSADGAIYNNAAQAFNHQFYWNCLSPSGGGEPKGPLAEALTKEFGSVAKFKELFTESSMTIFGSGWAWLVKDKRGKLKIMKASNADNPLLDNEQPILTCDVWEHAYYIDYRNARAKYLEAFWHIVNWRFASENFSA